MTEETRIVSAKRQREEEQDDGRDKARLRPETQATLAIAKAQQIERTSPLVAPTMVRFERMGRGGYVCYIYVRAFNGGGVERYGLGFIIKNGGG